MKIIYRENETYLLRIDKNEEMVTMITNFLSMENISAAYFTVIGATSEVTISYYNLATKSYEDHLIKENMEIVSITGNVAVLNNQPVIHAHGVLSKNDLSTMGGHIKKLIVSATCEIYLHKLNTTIERERNEEIGLNLLK